MYREMYREFHVESVQNFCFSLLNMQICIIVIAVVVVFAYNSSVIVTHKRWNCCVSWSWKESNKSSANNSCRDAIIRWRPTLDLLLSSSDPITKFGWSTTELHQGDTCELEKSSWQLPFSTAQSELADFSCHSRKPLKVNEIHPLIYRHLDKIFLIFSALTVVQLEKTEIIHRKNAAKR